MSLTATLVYDATLIREAALHFWWRTVGWRFIAALALVAVSLVTLLGRGDRSWVVGVAATILVVGLSFAVAVFAVHYRNAMSKFRGLSSNRATFTATASTLSFSSDLGASTLPWSEVKELWRSKRVWLLLFSKAQFVTLPVASLPVELQEFVLKQVAASGGKVA
jgi:hypothetical protein